MEIGGTHYFWNHGLVACCRWKIFWTLETVWWSNYSDLTDTNPATDAHCSESLRLKKDGTLLITSTSLTTFDATCIAHTVASIIAD
jgi:hypothetical protein